MNCQCDSVAGICWVCRKKEKQEALKWWRGNAPWIYQETKLPLLPDHAAVRAVLAWWRRPSPKSKKWLYVHGLTGSGKTRTLWMLMRIIRRDSEPEWLPMVVQGGTFRNEIVNRTRPREKGERSYGPLQAYLDQLYQAGTLWFDELDKLKFSERVEDEFFSLLEYRAAYKMHTIFSGPLSQSEFRLKMSDADGPQIIRRIVQNSFVVEFKQPKRQAPRVTRKKALPVETISTEETHDEIQPATSIRTDAQCH